MPMMKAMMDDEVDGGWWWMKGEHLGAAFVSKTTVDQVSQLLKLSALSGRQFAGTIAGHCRDDGVRGFGLFRTN